MDIAQTLEIKTRKIHPLRNLAFQVCDSYMQKKPLDVMHAPVVDGNMDGQHSNYRII